MGRLKRNQACLLLNSHVRRHSLREAGDCHVSLISPYHDVCSYRKHFYRLRYSDKIPSRSTQALESGTATAEGKRLTINAFTFRMIPTTVALVSLELIVSAAQCSMMADLFRVRAGVPRTHPRYIMVYY